LVLPLQDLDEQGRISAKDIKQDNVARITEASSRYGAQEVATAVVSLGQEDGWRGRFTLLRGERGSTWVAQGTTAEEVVAQGVDQIADALAAPAATVTGSAEAVEVRVEGIANAQQFAQVESYLRTVPGVSNVVLRRLEPAYVTFSVNVAGGMATLTQAAAAGQALQAVGAGVGYFRLQQAATASAPAAAAPQTP
jgi:hypothetical protein